MVCSASYRTLICRERIKNPDRCRRNTQPVLPLRFFKIKTLKIRLNAKLAVVL